MSEATKDALDDAIRAHIADECDGRLCVGWLIITASMNGDDMADSKTHYFSEASDNLPMHSTLGLAAMLDHHLQDSLCGDDDE